MAFPRIEHSPCAGPTNPPQVARKPSPTRPLRDAFLSIAAESGSRAKLPTPSLLREPPPPSSSGDAGGQEQNRSEGPRGGGEMAENPQLFGNGMPVPFYAEMFVLARDGVEFHVDKIPSAPGGHVKAKGTIYLSNVRMVFVASKPVGNFFAFDMPLLHVHGEKFNQPIFHCNNISGFVEPVVSDNQSRALYSTHTFKILFKEGGCGTFVPLFLNLIASVRCYNQFEAQSMANVAPRVDPLQAAQTPVDDMMCHAYVDPNDPTKIFLQQPAPESQLRRRNYHGPADNAH